MSPTPSLFPACVVTRAQSQKCPEISLYDTVMMLALSDDVQMTQRVDDNRPHTPQREALKPPAPHP